MPNARKSKQKATFLRAMMKAADLLAHYRKRIRRRHDDDFGTSRGSTGLTLLAPARLRFTLASFSHYRQ